MAKLYYRHGTMNSGKSIEILRTAHNYNEQGKKVMLFTSPIDDRSGVGKVSSRVGWSESAQLLCDNLFDIVEKEKPDCVIIDEVQFAKAEHVDQFAMIVDLLNIPVIGYGLMTDFQGNMFEGSKRMLELCDKIEEVKTVCWYCNKKAKFNTRFEDGKAVFSGEQVDIGGNEKYLSLCRKCYMKEKANNIIWERGQHEGQET